VQRSRSGPRNLIVLGSTGTIGELTLEIARRHPDELRIVGLGAGRNLRRLAEQVAAHDPDVVAIADPADLAAVRTTCAGGRGRVWLAGDEGLRELAAWPGGEIVVNGIVGAAGLGPTLAALGAGRRLGLANKESLVLAGHLVRALLERGGGEIVPVDSEHSAIWQCLQGRPRGEVRRLVLTASGGPFREFSPEELARVTAAQALRHPVWRMGQRITVDSATLFNKGMELIEAHWLFDLPLERVAAVIHPQSVIHGMVELADGSFLAHLSRPDMRLPIQLALSLPARWDPPVAPWDPAAAPEPLTFERPDERRFPCLRIAREAGMQGGLAPTVVNAADEVLVGAFLAGRVPWGAIPEGLESVLGLHRPACAPPLDEILAADAWARGAAGAWIDALSHA